MQTKWASLFGTPFHSIASRRTENLFFFLLLSALIRWDCSALRLCLFHRLAIFFGTLSADLGPFLAFLVEHLFATQQFDECFVGTVTFSPCGTHNAEIAALSIAKTWSDGIKEFADRLVRHQVGRCLPSSCQVALFAERNHLLDQRTHRFCLDRSRLDPFFHDQRRDQIPEQRPPVRCVPSEFVSRNLVTHENLSCQWPVVSCQWRDVLAKRRSHPASSQRLKSGNWLPATGY